MDHELNESAAPVSETDAPASEDATGDNCSLLSIDVPAPAHLHDTGAEPVVLVESSDCAGDVPNLIVSEWLQCVNEHGEMYFCNVGTGETRWELAAAAVDAARSRGDRLESPQSASFCEQEVQEVDGRTSSGATLDTVASSDNAQARRRSIQLVRQVFDGAAKRLDRNVQMQFEEARRRHRELEELRDEQVRLGDEHWVEMYDPTHDGFYYYGAFSGELRWDRPESYVLKVESDAMLRLVVRLQCAFRMALARRRVFSAKKAQAAELQRRQTGGAVELKRVQDASHPVAQSRAGTEAVEDDNENDDDDDVDDGEKADVVGDGEQFGIIHRGSSGWLTPIPEQRLGQQHEQDADSDDVWVEVYDPLQKLVYYYCAATSETRWNPPTVFISAGEDKEMAAAIAIQALSRSFLARRDVKHRKLTIRKRRQEQAAHEAQQLRERRRREFASKSEDERASICRREMIEEEMAQIRAGDRFWGLDAHDREVRRQQAEERLMVMSELFWQRVTITARTRTDRFARATTELELQRREAESAAEADACAALRAEEAQQRQLGDDFWGIQGQEQREQRARRDMRNEEARSRCLGQDALVRDLHAAWQAEAEGNAARSAQDKVVSEKRYQKKYMKWFYHDCTSVDDLLGYLWPTTKRAAPLAPSSRTPTKSGVGSPVSSSSASSYLLDDLVVQRRLADGDLRYGNKSIFTIHHSNSAQMLGRKGGFRVEAVAGTKAAYEFAMAKYKPPPSSPAQPAPHRVEMTLEEDERLRMGTSVHYKRAKAPDPHLPARFNDVPFKPSQISPTRDILCGSHTKLTQLPSLAAPSALGAPPAARTRPMSPGRPAKPAHTKSAKRLSLARRHSPTRNSNNNNSDDSPRAGSFLQRHTERLRRGSYHDPLDLTATTFGFAAPCARESPYRQRRRLDGEADDVDTEDDLYEDDMGEESEESESSGDDDVCDERSGGSGAHHNTREHVPRDVLLEQFALNERDLLQRVFAMMDYDGSGAVNQNEMAWALQRDEEIAALATQSALLRAFVQRPGQLDELFLRPRPSRSFTSALGHLKASAESDQELSWADFLEFCQHKYVELTNEGVLEPPRGLRPQLQHQQLNPPSVGKNGSSLSVRDTKGDAATYHEDEEEAKIRDLFAILDCDANGVLEVEELQLALADAANDRDIGELVRSCKALQPLLHQATFTEAFRKFEPENPRGISEEEFVAFCLEIAAIAQFNGLL
ncbi:hypothetical protein PybrP1_000169 [[Pythium] brassicae (nom. inval.)]|nr:hypothetical protein PybrP1_000169 [[Pythium] brassicae (nom. inval.)]